jgi:hypothetical protein
MKPKVANNTFNLFFDEFNRIPSFIDTKGSIDKVIWEQMYSINENLFNLFTLTTLPNRRLKSIHNTNELYLEIISDIISGTSKASYGYDIHKYYEDMFNTYIGISEANEEFEISANLLNYYNLFIK